MQDFNFNEKQRMRVCIIVCNSDREKYTSNIKEADNKYIYHKSHYKLKAEKHHHLISGTNIIFFPLSCCSIPLCIVGFGRKEKTIVIVWIRFCCSIDEKQQHLRAFTLHMLMGAKWKKRTRMDTSDWTVNF